MTGFHNTTVFKSMAAALIVSAAAWSGPLARRWWPDVSRQLVTGGFLQLHVRGDRANACFGLEHPPAVDSIARSL